MDAGDNFVHNPGENRWRPSIHMPRWASRILLEVADIQVEQVQDISKMDAIAEGVTTDEYGASARDVFSELWDSINEKRGFGWDTNPWVWVVSFEVVKT